MAVILQINPAGLDQFGLADLQDSAEMMCRRRRGLYQISYKNIKGVVDDHPLLPAFLSFRPSSVFPSLQDLASAEALLLVLLLLCLHVKYVYSKHILISLPLVLCA